MSNIYYYASAQPAAQQLETAVGVAVNNIRFQGVNNDISKAKTDNTLERTKSLVNNIAYGTIKTDDTLGGNK